ncbi:MAG: DNA polymerase/3'-5' exonuclease PolX [Terriglobales bacterium]
MENREVAERLRQTADLLEVAGEDSFRVRSYRKAADVVDTCPEPVAALCLDPKRLLALPGIGRTMAGHIQELVSSGELGLHRELLARFQPGMLELLQINGLGPKTVAMIWQTYQAGTLDAVEALAQAGQLQVLPRMGPRAEEKILKGIAAYRQMRGRMRRDQAEAVLQLLLPGLASALGVAGVAVAGSYRRGRDTVGDLDILMWGPGFPASAAAARERVLQAPRLEEVLGQGDNKISLRLHAGTQVDVRLLPPESAGAALQYFTGSQQHNIQLRARAQQMGLKLNEYGLFRETGGAPGERVAGDSEEAVYAALGLAWIPPELREASGEIEAAAAGQLPRLIEAADLRGDLHMHTTASDGRTGILEMAAAAAERGYRYVAITDHSQALAMANGLDERRMLEHLEAIRAAERTFQQQHAGFRIFAGIEVDILADGRLDMADEVLAQLDWVIGSIHSRFDQPEAETTARLVRAVSNPHLDVLGHPSGRLLLRREAYRYDFEQVVEACREHGVAMEINASPERLDLNEVQARRARQRGVMLTINTDAHHPRHLDNMRYGLATARRAWLQAGDVVNTASDPLRLVHREPASG